MMLFFNLALMLTLTWCAPWWVILLPAFAIGWRGHEFRRAGWSVSLSAGLAWASLAYVQDVANAGLVSRRMGGLLHLPHPLLIFLIMGALGFLTAAFAFQSGAAAKGLIRASTKN